MSRFLSKKEILDRIKTFYNLKNNAKLAAFLGIPPTTLSSWYSRDTFDLDVIYEKCVDIDLAWLLTGRGSMLKEKQMEDKVATNATNTSNTQIEHISTGTKTENNALLYNMYSDLQKKDAKIESLNKELTELKLINQKQEAYIEKLVRVLEHYENIGTIQDTNNMQEDNVGDVPFVESSLLTPLPSARANVRIGKRRKQ